MARYGGESNGLNLLSYECDIGEVESASWVQMKLKGVRFMTPLMFSSSYATPPESLCIAQIYNQKAPTQTDGGIEYACMHIRPQHKNESMHVSISALQMCPDAASHAQHGQSADTRRIPINCTKMNLPLRNCIRVTANGTNKDITSSLQTIQSELQEKSDSNVQVRGAGYNMRMNHSLVAPTVENSKLSILTAGTKMWQDKTSSAYLATVAPTTVTGTGNDPNFAVCTSNRIWQQNGGDPNILVCCLNQNCVELINTILPMLQMCKAIDGCGLQQEKLLKLMRLGIGGSVLGEQGKLSLCHKGDGSVISPVVFLRKPNKADISKKGQLHCECDMFLFDTETEIAMVQNPAIFGEGLLTVFSSNDSMHLHGTNREVDMSNSLLPRCQPLQQLASEHPSKELAIAEIGEWHGRLSTRYKVHSMYDFVCAIDQSNSKLMTYQTMGNTYQLQRPLDKKAESLICNSLAMLSNDYSTFKAFASLVGKSSRLVSMPTPKNTAGAILASAPAINEAMSAIVPEMLPDSIIGKQIYNKLQSSKTEFQTACAHYLPQTQDNDPDPTAHLAPIRHAQKLGGIQRICLIASGACNSPTNNRAVLLVQKRSPPDVVVLFIDRHLGTDPEYFSSDLRMDSQSLAKASSVRTALGIDTDAQFHVHSVTRMSSDTTNLFTNKHGNRIHGKRYPMFTVQWKTDALSEERNRTIFSVFTSNRVRTDCTSQTPIGRIITSESPDNEVYATFNQNWGIRVLSNTVA